MEKTCATCTSFNPDHARDDGPVCWNLVHIVNKDGARQPVFAEFCCDNHSDDDAPPQ